MTWINDYVRELKAAWPDVIVMDGFYERSNGSSWATGGPDAQINHHLVTPTTEQYEPVGADMARDGHSALSGPLCNVYIAYDGTIWLVSAGPANHAGWGRRAVLDRARRDIAPTGTAFQVYGNTGGASGRGSDDYNDGNRAYWGYELQHPGDSTPYPGVQIQAMATANAVMAKVHGWSANRSIHHKEHSYRKIDLSWPGDLRAVVRAALVRLTTPPIPGPSPLPTPIPPEDITMTPDVEARFAKLEKATGIAFVEIGGTHYEIFPDGGYRSHTKESKAARVRTLTALGQSGRNLPDGSVTLDDLRKGGRAR